MSIIASPLEDKQKGWQMRGLGIDHFGQFMSEDGNGTML